MDNDNPSYYAIIPAGVRYDPDLPPAAKLLYGELTALSNKHGFCWATNGYFADLYRVDVRTITRWITELSDCGYIHVETPPGERRKIYVAAGTLDKNVYTSRQKCLPPLDKNVLHNNKENNTKNIQRDVLPIAPVFKSPSRRPQIAAIHREVAVWLNAVAPLVGAKSGRTMSNEQAWSDIAAKAIIEGFDVAEFMAVTKQEVDRTRDTPQFFSPNNVLKVMQAQKTKPTPSKWMHEV